MTLAFFFHLRLVARLVAAAFRGGQGGNALAPTRTRVKDLPHCAIMPASSSPPAPHPTTAWHSVSCHRGQTRHSRPPAIPLQRGQYLQPYPSRRRRPLQCGNPIAVLRVSAPKLASSSANCV